MNFVLLAFATISGGRFHLRNNTLHIQPKLLSKLMRFRCFYCCSTLRVSYSNNFVGAKNVLLDLKQVFLSEYIEDEIQRKFIPLRSPHFGGLWWADMKSVKQQFYRTFKLNTVTLDELRTLVCTIFAV